MRRGDGGIYICQRQRQRPRGGALQEGRRGGRSLKEGYEGRNRKVGERQGFARFSVKELRRLGLGREYACSRVLSFVHV